MKNFVLFIIVVLSSLFIVHSPTFADESSNNVNYPIVVQNIRCLIIGENGELQVNQSIEIEKSQLDKDGTIEYGIKSAIKSDLDYGSELQRVDETTFQANNGIFRVNLIISRNKENFLEPSKMEPFYIQYHYESKFFQSDESYEAKCLHRIF